MIFYNTNKESLLKMLKEIITKKNGKFFSHSDCFDPAWGGLFNLLLHSQHPRFKLENNWPELIKTLELVDYKKYISGNLEDRNIFLKKWPNHSYIEIWIPFLEKIPKTLRQSFLEWINTDDFAILDMESYSEEDKKNILKSIKDNFNTIFTIFSEINNNSVFHGFNSEKNLTTESFITGFIKQNIDASWDIFHADLGSTIVKNIREKSNSPIREKSDKKIMEWVTKLGNTSKSKEEFPLSGGGISFLKQLCLHKRNEIFCISGGYKITFDSIDNLEKIEDINDVDNAIISKVEKNDFYFPGTLWLVHINKIDLHKKDGEQNNLKDIEEEAEYNKSLEEYLKEYII